MASIITPYGLGKIAEAAQYGTPLNVTGIEIGNGPAITKGSAVGIGGASMYTIPQQDITVSLDATSDPNHPTIRAEGTIPSSIPGGFTISSIALKDGNNVIAVVDGQGDTMNGAESVNPQTYSVLFLLPLSSTENFGIVMGAGGNYLPLAGGTMDEGAEIIVPQPVTGPDGKPTTKISGAKIVLFNADPFTPNAAPNSIELMPGSIKVKYEGSSSNQYGVELDHNSVAFICRQYVSGVPGNPAGVYNFGVRLKFEINTTTRDVKLLLQEGDNIGGYMNWLTIKDLLAP
jgi:hypothetical protein